MNSIDPLGVGGISERNIVIANYVLYGSFFITGIIGPIVGLIISYIHKRKFASNLGKSHVANQIGLFWKCLAGVIGGAVLLAVSLFSTSVPGSSNLMNDHALDYLLMPGVAVIMFSLVWFLIKLIIGFVKASGNNSI